MATSDLEQFIERYHRALDAFVQGDPEPVQQLFSRRDDVTLANPLGPAVRGWSQVAEATVRAASQVREGEPVVFEIVSEGIAARNRGSVGRRTGPSVLALDGATAAGIDPRPAGVSRGRLDVGPT
jgi:hypothetical protein